MSPHKIISEIDGLGDKTAKKLIWNARNALGMTEFIAAGEIDENTEYITTGSSELNRILGGGFQTRHFAVENIYPSDTESFSGTFELSQDYTPAQYLGIYSI